MVMMCVWIYMDMDIEMVERMQYLGYISQAPHSINPPPDSCESVRRRDGKREHV